MNENARNSMLDGLGASVTHVSLHGGWPALMGDNEISGGGPAYARVGVTWDPATGGVLAASSQPTFNIPPGASISWCGFWGDVSSTAPDDYYGAVPLGSGAPAVAQFSAPGDLVTVVAHPFVADQTVTFLDTLGSIPGGITEGTIYWVRDVTTDSFKVAASLGGAAVDLLTGGVALVYSIVEETYNQQGLHSFTSLNVAVA